MCNCIINISIKQHQDIYCVTSFIMFSIVYSVVLQFTFFMGIFSCGQHFYIPSQYTATNRICTKATQTNRKLNMRTRQFQTREGLRTVKTQWGACIHGRGLSLKSHGHENYTVPLQTGSNTTNLFHHLQKNRVKQWEESHGWEPQKYSWVLKTNARLKLWKRLLPAAHHMAKNHKDGRRLQLLLQITSVKTWPQFIQTCTLQA